MLEEMTAVVNFAAASGSVELREKARPRIADDQVLLKVEAVGVCGSDVHQWHGTHSWHVNYPCTLGHEFGGTVAQVGAAVTSVKEGDGVVSETAAVIDPNSPYTRRGLYNLDPSRLGFGYGVDGAMANYVAVPERCLHHLPTGLSFEKAALTEPCCVAFNAVCMQARIHPGDTVVVIGPGPIGLLCAQMAKLSGAGRLIVSGTKSDSMRLEIAKALGADMTLQSDLVETVRSIGDGMGADVVVDAAGVSQTLKEAIDCVRPAGQVVKVGWGPDAMNFSLDAAVMKAVTIQGSFSHNWPMWERVLDMLATGQLNLDPIISKVSTLEDWESCFTGMMNGSLVKAVLKPTG